MNNSNGPPPLNPPFHGWKILALATFSQMVSIGFTVYLLGLYIDPLAKAFDTGRAAIGWGSAIFYAGMALMGPLLGVLVDRGKVRQVMTAGAVMLALGLGLLSRADALIHAAIICIFLIAPGSAMLGMVPATAMVIQWFDRRRGFAVGICIAGLSLGGFLVPPFAAWLISVFDWRTNLLVLSAIVALVLVPAAWLVAVAKPADIGQFPDGDSPVDRTAPPSPAPKRGFRELVLSRHFWSLALCTGLLSFSGVSISTFLIPFSIERGLTIQTSALMLSLVTGMAFLAKFVAGWLCDRFGSANVLTAISVGTTIGWLPMLHIDSLTALIGSAALVGFSTGSLTPAMANLIARQFGADAYGRVQGAMGPATILFLIIPGPLGGYLYDLHSSYESALSALWWVIPFAIPLSLWMPRESGKPRHSPAHKVQER